MPAAEELAALGPAVPGGLLVLEHPPGRPMLVQETQPVRLRPAQALRAAGDRSRRSAARVRRADRIDRASEISTELVDRSSESSERAGGRASESSGRASERVRYRPSRSSEISTESVERANRASGRAGESSERESGRESEARYRGRDGRTRATERGEPTEPTARRAGSIPPLPFGWRPPPSLPRGG